MHVGSSRHTRERNLRARESMGYLRFVRLVASLWANSHPDVPVVPSGGSQDAEYPCIIYGLELRQTHRSDPKQRLREVIDDDGEAYVIHGQRFQNVVSFTAMTEQDPVLCEEIIEVFEDFMMEMTPVLKEAGASELVYSRRYADDEERRQGEGVVTRKVAYLLTTEKVVSEKTSKLEAIIANIGLMGEQVTTHGDPYIFQEITPRYWTLGGRLPTFTQSDDDIKNDLILIPRSGFVIGDIVYLSPHYSRTEAFPSGIGPGYYMISEVVGNPYHAEVRYGLSTRDGAKLDLDPELWETLKTYPRDYIVYHNGENYQALEDTSDEPPSPAWTTEVEAIGNIRFEPEAGVTTNIIEHATPETYS